MGNVKPRVRQIGRWFCQVIVKLKGWWEIIHAISYGLYPIVHDMYHNNNGDVHFSKLN